MGENRESGSRHSATGTERSPRSTASTTKCVHTTSEVDQIHSTSERLPFTHVAKVVMQHPPAVTPSSELLRRRQVAGDIPTRLAHATLWTSARASRVTASPRVLPVVQVTGGASSGRRAAGLRRHVQAGLVVVDVAVADDDHCCLSARARRTVDNGCEMGGYAWDAIGSQLMASRQRSLFGTGLGPLRQAAPTGAVHGPGVLPSGSPSIR